MEVIEQKGLGSIVPSRGSFTWLKGHQNKEKTKYSWGAHGSLEAGEKRTKAWTLAIWAGYHGDAVGMS